MTHSTNVTALTVFVVLFAVVTVMGFLAARWRLRAAGSTQAAQDATVPADYDEFGPAGDLGPSEAAPAVMPRPT